MIAAFLVLSAVFTANNAEIVVDDAAAPVVRFAAQEAKTFLSQALSCEVPVVAAPTDGRTSLVLGANVWSSGAGLSTNELSRDAFVIRACGSRVYVLGRDSATVDPSAVMRNLGGWSGVVFERGSLFGVYDFLERHVGVRFYFPGELGTIVPKADRIEVREGTLTVKPDFMSRFMSAWDGEYFEPDAGESKRTLNYFRQRFETTRKPCCHGSTGFMYPQRFGKTHPEYFALLPNGCRSISADKGSGSLHPGQLCWSSGVVGEMYLDAKSYLTGEDAFVRGIPSRSGRGYGWNNCTERLYVDVMPQDGWTGCLCEKCRGRDDGELVWSAVAGMARRLTDEGVRGRLVNMAYGPCRKVPDIELPPNIDVMVAATGQWLVGNPTALANDSEPIVAWAKKLGHKVWIWTYPGKWGALESKAKGLPTPAPRAWARYYKALAPYIDGGFAESETDRWFNNALNYYVFSRVCWDNATDVEAVLSEHHRLMFGAAAPDLAAVYDKLESWWIDETTGHVVETMIGPMMQLPVDSRIFTKIYSPARIEELVSHLAAGRRKVSEGSLEARRIDLVEREFVRPLKAASARYFERLARVRDLQMTLAVGDERKIALRPFGLKEGVPPKATVKTDVTVRRESDALLVRFDCEEPYMDDRAAKTHPADDPDLWKDDCVEIVFAPNVLEPGRTFHVFVNSEGSVADSCESDPKVGYGWNGDVRAFVEKRADGWTAEMRLPLSGFGHLKEEMPVEFARERNLKTHGDIHHLYNWSPMSVGFDDLENLGRIVFK